MDFKKVPMSKLVELDIPTYNNGEHALLHMRDDETVVIKLGEGRFITVSHIPGAHCVDVKFHGKDVNNMDFGNNLICFDYANTMESAIEQVDKYDESPTCIGCKKEPHEILEYRLNGDGEDPDDYVRKHEGTYDMFQPNKFYCDTCYINAGMPIHDGKRQF